MTNIIITPIESENKENKPRRSQALKEAQKRYYLKNKDKILEINHRARRKYYFNVERNRQDNILPSIRKLFKEV